MRQYIKWDLGSTQELLSQEWLYFHVDYADHSSGLISPALEPQEFDHLRESDIHHHSRSKGKNAPGRL